LGLEVRPCIHTRRKDFLRHHTATEDPPSPRSNNNVVAAVLVACPRSCPNLRVWRHLRLEHLVGYFAVRVAMLGAVGFQVVVVVVVRHHNPVVPPAPVLLAVGFNLHQRNVKRNP
jgi:hypothetical protein